MVNAFDNQYNPNLITASKASDIVWKAKHELHIDKPNNQLTFSEIQEVCRLIGKDAPDTKITKITTDGKDVEKIEFGKIGWQTMISITLMEFPWYYDEFQLIQTD